MRAPECPGTAYADAGLGSAITSGASSALGGCRQNQVRFLLLHCAVLPPCPESDALPLSLWSIPTVGQARSYAPLFQPGRIGAGISCRNRDHSASWHLCRGVEAGRNYSCKGASQGQLSVSRTPQVLWLHRRTPSPFARAASSLQPILLI